ncbi:MAG TPA: CoA transferase [Candidatus Binataceae bacterium]|nr:CoA transferase [Candidatus Binataceae bacterium]
MSKDQILSGYTVLDFTQAVAGPAATLMMAEMGAHVIKIEFAPRGDLTRTFPYFKDGRSGCFVQFNRGKQSLCVALKTPEGLKIIQDLLKDADVLVENFTPGVMDRLGLGYEAVRAINPKIVMCSISSFGQTGPLAYKSGFDTIGAAYSGVLSRIGEPDGPPPMLQSAFGDVGAGVYALAAIGYALLHREHTGVGQHLETTLIDTYFNYHETAIEAFSASKGALKTQRTGRFAPLHSATGMFKARRGFIMFCAAPPHHFEALCKAMGRPELITDPRFSDNEKRVANGAYLTAAIEQWLQSLPSDEEGLRILEQHHIPASPILSVEEAMDERHLRDRGTVRTINDPVLGEFNVPGFPIKFSQTPAVEDLPAPFLGQHNAEVLMSRLNYTPGHVRALEEKGILHRDPIPPEDIG